MELYGLIDPQLERGTLDHEMLYWDAASQKWTKTGSALTWNDGTSTLTMGGFLVDKSSTTNTSWSTEVMQSALIGTRYKSGSGGANIIGRKAGGTLGSEAFLTTNNTVISINARVWGGSDFSGNVAFFSFRPESQHSSGDLPMHFRMALAPDGSASASDVMFVRNDGDVEVVRGDLEILLDNKYLKIGATLTDIQVGSDGTNGIITVATALRLGSATTNYAQVNSTGDINQVGTGRTLESAKYKLTAIGGYAIKLTNKTGSSTVRGRLVIASTGTADAFETAGADAVNVIGIVLDGSIADGSEAWVVIAGIAIVLMDSGGCALGDRLIASGTAGSADVSNSPATAVHFQEIGHAIEAREGLGNAKAVIHFL